MCGIAPSMRPEKSREELVTDLWQVLRRKLLNCATDYNILCRESVWAVTMSDQESGPVRVSLACIPANSVDIAADLQTGCLKCEYSRGFDSPQLEIQVNSEGAAEFRQAGKPIQLDALIDLILMPLVPAIP